VLARVKSKQLRVVDAAPLLRLSYRQAKRLWRLYREEGAGAGAGEVQRGGRRAIWTDADNGTLGIGRWREGGGGNAAAVDAGGRVVESGTEEAAAPETARAQGALWRNGAAGRELSPVAGGTWPGRLLDRYGR